MLVAFAVCRLFAIAILDQTIAANLVWFDRKMIISELQQKRVL